jgi:hypothetical protein
MKHDTLKKLEDELEVINNSLQGRKSIEAAKLLTELQTTNSKEILFNAMRELYKFSKKTLKALESISTGAPVSGPTSDDIKSMIKQEFTDTLPGLLQEALKKHSSMEKPLENEDKAPETSHTLILENIPTSQNEDTAKEEAQISDDHWTTVVSKHVNKTLSSVPVIKARAANGAAKLHFKSKEDQEKAKEALQASYRVTSKTEEIKKLDPKVTIYDLSVDITSKELLEERKTLLEKKLLEKNEYIRVLKNSGETCKIIYVDKNNSSGSFGVLQVSPKIRDAMKQNRDRVCIDLQVHVVKDRVHAVQCFHCQEFGHMSKSPFCKKTDFPATCFYCAGSHKSKECTKKGEQNKDAMKCSNCAKSKNSREKNKCHTHKASDTLCPFFVKEKERIMARTAGYPEQAKNSYVQKAKELQRKYGRV